MLEGAGNYRENYSLLIAVEAEIVHIARASGAVADPGKMESGAALINRC